MVPVSAALRCGRSALPFFAGLRLTLLLLLLVVVVVVVVPPLLFFFFFFFFALLLPRFVLFVSFSFPSRLRWWCSLPRANDPLCTRRCLNGRDDDNGDDDNGRSSSDQERECVDFDIAASFSATQPPPPP